MTKDKKKKPIKVSSRKAKGRVLQDFVCEQVSKLLGISWGRDDDDEIRPRPMGQPGPDVILSKKVRSLFPFTFECKNQETWSLLTFVNQAKDNVYEGTDWVLVLKKNRITPLVVMDFDAFLRLVGGLCKKK